VRAAWLLAGGALLAATGARTAAHADAAPGWLVRFVDVALAAGLTRPVIYGGETEKRFIIETNGTGVAWLDVDDDGFIDALVMNGTRLQPGTRAAVAWSAAEAPLTRLYRNRGNGSFEDITAGSGLGTSGWASSACAGDYDNDGRIDLFLTAYGQNRLFRNAGNGSFTEMTAKTGLASGTTRWGSGCSFIDYDRDGRLDLFVSNYLKFDLATAAEKGQGMNCLWKGIAVNCGPKGLPFETQQLFHQETDGRFRDVSEQSGIAAAKERYAMTVAAADFDGDGWVDLYVACDTTAAILYRNNRDGTFTDRAIASGAAFSEYGNAQAGMGLAVGDYDTDARLDILKMHFADDIPALYRNAGGGLFEDVASVSGLAAQNRYVEWGGGLPDLDNDGLPDIFYVTGNVYPEIEKHLPQYPHRSPRIVFANVGGGIFRDVSALSGPGAAAAHSSRGAAFGDYDNDGDLDVLVMNMNEPPSLLRNDLAPARAWLAFRLRGTRSNRAALGATLVVTAAGRRQAQALLSQSSYYSVNDLRLHYGLGDAQQAERVEVHWPSGLVEEFGPQAANRVVTLVEGEGRAAAKGE
jgi:hypothetical protein